MTIIEGIATIFGLLCVWLTVKQNIWCWPAGIIQVFLYIFVFYEARLYSDVLLHIIFVFLNVYGWYHWLKKGNGKDELSVSLLGSRMIIWLIVCFAGTLVLGFIMATYTDASLPYPDSFITVASLTAQWLMARKKLESWLFWIAVDLVAIVVYWIKDLFLTTGLFSVFLVLAVIGYLEWRKSVINAPTKQSPLLH